MVRVSRYSERWHGVEDKTVKGPRTKNIKREESK